jgi:hypothetical protein
MGCIIFKVEYLSILQLFQIVKLCFANFGWMLFFVDDLTWHEKLFGSVRYYEEKKF